MFKTKCDDNEVIAKSIKNLIKIQQNGGLGNIQMASLMQKIKSGEQMGPLP